MKKSFKLVLALVLALVMSFSVFAIAEGGAESGSEPATSTKKTINLTGGKAGHTYTLYQIFTGKVDGAELTDLQWGSDAPDAMKTKYPTAAAAAEAIATQDDAREFAHDYTFTGGTTLELSADGAVKFENLDEGYYVILDTNNNSAAVEGDYTSAVVVKVVKDVDGAMKGEAPSSEKKVKDTNDSDTDHSGDAYADSADYDIGDAVPFQLKATTASNTNTYSKYHITFQDKLSTGLTAPTEYKITVLGKEFTLTSSGTAITESTSDTKITVENATVDSGNTFAIKVTFEPTAEPANEDDWVYLADECNSTDIIVEYTAVLNDSAKFGKEGNPNTSYIKYSTNPESKDDSDTHEGKTPEDTVIVFTYKTFIDKVDETGEALNGADFTLYKQVNEGDEGAVKGSDITFAEGVEHAAIKADKYYVVVGNKTGDATGATFEFKGVDDGTYVLVETTVPTGYNAWESKEVTITATHTDGDTPELTELTATEPFTDSNAEAGTVERTKEGATHDRPSGEAYAEIINKSGAELPETGGIGTTIFYVAGSILVLAAAVLLVTKRRMNAND